MTSLRFQDPKPGARVQVIGAGLPRTGTNSFCAALQILLHGPCYHSGVQWGAQGATDEKHIKTMIRAAGSFPWNEATKRSILAELETLLRGYVAVADPPLSILYAELLELYPEAKVIVTVRDLDPWSRSMLEITKTVTPKLIGFLLFWLPSVRWLPAFSAALTNLFSHKYGVTMRDKETCSATWEKHCAQLEKVVPADQLFYFNVKDGWKPLCEALDLPVPDVPFPRLNDAKDLEDHFKNLAARGFVRWMLLLVLSSAIICAALPLVSGSILGLETVQRNYSTLLLLSGCLVSLLPVLWRFS